MYFVVFGARDRFHGPPIEVGKGMRRRHIIRGECEGKFYSFKIAGSPIDIGGIEQRRIGADPVLAIGGIARFVEGSGILDALVKEAVADTYARLAGAAEDFSQTSARIGGRVGNPYSWSKVEVLNRRQCPRNSWIEGLNLPLW